MRSPRREIWGVGLVALSLGASLVALIAACGSGGHSDDPDSLPNHLRAHVVRAVDGDTALVRLGGRTEYVRYIGVDTPETVKPDTPVQCFGPQASAFDHRLVDDRTVRLDFDREREDAYGRLLAYVHAGGRFINAALVRAGFARTLSIAPNTAHAGLFARLAERAARRGRGLWGRC